MASVRSKTVYHYILFGERVASELPLGELAAARFKNPSIRFRISTTPRRTGIRWYHRIRSPRSQRLVTSFGRARGAFVVRFHGLADFVISSDGSRITATPMRKADLSEVAAFLLSQALPLALTLRKIPMVHASAVEISGRAALFVGPQGVGKSTLAAAFVRNGRRLLSDDAVGLVPRRQGYAIFPSYSEIRLFADSARQLLSLRASGQSASSKIRTAVPNQRSHRAIPVGAVYLLSPGTRRDRTCTFSDLKGQQGWIELVQNALRLDLTNPHLLAHEAGVLAELVDRVPIRTLRIPRNLSALGGVVDAITKDLLFCLCCPI